MAKIPDFSELTKKFDIQGLVDSVKSAVSGGPPPKAPEGDEVAAKFVDVINLTQNVIAAHAEQGKVLSTIHQQLTTLYKEVQLLKEAGNSGTGETPKETPAATESNTAAEDTEDTKQK